MPANMDQIDVETLELMDQIDVETLLELMGQIDVESLLELIEGKIKGFSSDKDPRWLPHLERLERIKRLRDRLKNDLRR